MRLRFDVASRQGLRITRLLLMSIAPSAFIFAAGNLPRLLR